MNYWYSSADSIIVPKSVSGTRSTHPSRANACTFLVGKSEGRRVPGKSKFKWEDNIKMDLKEMGLCTGF